MREASVQTYLTRSHCCEYMSRALTQHKPAAHKQLNCMWVLRKMHCEPKSPSLIQQPHPAQIIALSEKINNRSQASELVINKDLKAQLNSSGSNPS